MAKRGRPSADSLTVRPLVQLPQRFAEPPGHLTPAQAETWRMVVSTPTGDMIGPECFGVLTEYCRCVEHAEKVAEQLDQVDPSWAKDDDGLKRWDKLLGMQDRLAARIALLATKLRATPSTRYRASKAALLAEKANKLKPWEVAE